MKIADIRTIALSCRCDPPYASAAGVQSQRAALLVEIETDNGIVGIGEAGIGGGAAASVIENALNRLKLVFNSWKKLTHRTFARKQGYIGSQARAAFRGAVAFDNADAELPHPDIGRRFLQFFSAGKQITERTKIIRVSFASVAVQKGIRGEENRAIEIVKRGRDHAVMQGRDVEENEHLPNQREQEPDCEAKAMEQWQGIEEPIGFQKVHH